LNKLVEVENKAMRQDLEKFSPGDTVKVFFRVHEGKKDKVQAFQGICIKMSGAGPNRSFTVRKISQGVGVERIFPLHSPTIEKIEIIRLGKVRRAKLYYLREAIGKKHQVKERVVAKKTEKAVRTKHGKKAKGVVEEKPAVETPEKEVLNAKPESGSESVEKG